MLDGVVAIILLRPWHWDRAVSLRKRAAVSGSLTLAAAYAKPLLSGDQSRYDLSRWFADHRHRSEHAGTAQYQGSQSAFLSGIYPTLSGRPALLVEKDLLFQIGLFEIGHAQDRSQYTALTWGRIMTGLVWKNTGAITASSIKIFSA